MIDITINDFTVTISITINVTTWKPLSTSTINYQPKPRSTDVVVAARAAQELS